MVYKTLGNSDVKVSTITFGAWAIGGWMWGGADVAAALKAIEKGIDLGVTSIDTAPVYGFGQSEEIVGKAIKGKREKVQILTKYGLRWLDKKGQFYFASQDNDGKPIDIYRYSAKESVIKECEESLKRLGTDYIDLYQIHWADPTTPVSETMEAMEMLYKQGKIRAAGVSNYSAGQMKEALESFPIVSNQVPYSMLKRDIEEEVVPFCIKKNQAILAYSPLQRGLLTGKIKPDTVYGEGDTRTSTPYYKPENIMKVNAFLGEIKPLADSKNATLAQLVLAWTLKQPGITVVLAGARTDKQIEDNAGAGNLNLTKEEIGIIDNALLNLKLEM
ncbi:MAG: aldo/keto reductase [Bacteroidales bacterium]|nr:aldo/keto reductase [Bacteroidales bacterium]